MNEKEISNPAHGCVVAVVGFQLVVILLALGLTLSDYLRTSSEFLIWRYEHGMRNFRGVNLPYNTNLSGVVLAGANLSEADLQKADLTGADLTGATLFGARLDGANLTGATISAEQLAQAFSLGGATLPDGTVHE